MKLKLQALNYRLRGWNIEYNSPRWTLHSAVQTGELDSRGLRFEKLLTPLLFDQNQSSHTYLVVYGLGGLVWKVVSWVDSCRHASLSKARVGIIWYLISINPCYIYNKTTNGDEWRFLHKNIIIFLWLKADRKMYNWKVVVVVVVTVILILIRYTLYSNLQLQ